MSNRGRGGWTLLTLAVFACAWASTAGAAGDSEQAGESAVDRELLEGLDAELLEDLMPPGGETGVTNEGEEAEAPARDALDEELLRELGAEAEVEQDPNPLSRAGRRMQRVEELIGRARSGSDTQDLQQRIVEDLDTMIERARQQAQKMQSSQQSQQSSKRSKSRQPGQPQPTEGGAPRDEPAEDSTERLGAADARRPDMAELNELMKELWGHLPQREREQVMNAQIEQFLPKYELLIESYFRRLLDARPEGRR